MKRTWRNHKTDLWGHATGLKQIHVGNHMNLPMANVNTAINYGECPHKPIEGKVVKDDKELQRSREIAHQIQNRLNAERHDKNITNSSLYDYTGKKRQNL